MRDHNSRAFPLPGQWPLVCIFFFAGVPLFRTLVWQGQTGANSRLAIRSFPLSRPFRGTPVSRRLHSSKKDSHEEYLRRQLDTGVPLNWPR